MAKGDRLNSYLLTERLQAARKRFIINSTEQALYHELGSVCNEWEWSEIFSCPNDRLTVNLRVSEPTLIRSRETLINAGILFYRSGKSKRKYGDYSFVIPFPKEAKRTPTAKPILAKALPNPLPNVLANPLGDTLAKALDYNKHKLKLKVITVSNETVRRKFWLKIIAINKKEKEKKVAAKKEKVWQSLVKVWFEFYESQKSEKPTFEGQHTKALKGIAAKLRERSEKKNMPWDETRAKETLTHFLTYAFSDPWLKDNFLLTNLEKQFDKIITNGKQQPAATNNPKGHQHIDGLSALSKFRELNNQP